MPATTAKGFSYPVNADPVNIPGDIQTLATGIDNYLTNVPTLTSTSTLTNKTLTSPTVNTPTITDGRFIGDVSRGTALNTTAANGALTFDVGSGGALLYYGAAATGNFTVNFRWSSSTSLLTRLPNTGDVVTAALIVVNGATPYFLTSITVDGVSRTVRWQGGSAPVGGNANSTDVYAFNIIKVDASNVVVLAAQTRFA